MLVLKFNRRIAARIGKDVLVRILGVHGNSVRIGIEAPKTTPIVRAELLGEDSEGRKRHEAKMRGGNR